MDINSIVEKIDENSEQVLVRDRYSELTGMIELSHLLSDLGIEIPAVIYGVIIAQQEQLTPLIEVTMKYKVKRAQNIRSGKVGAWK